MRENELEVNAFVYHRDWGVGRIAALEDNGQWVLADFRDRTGHRMAREIRAIGTCADAKEYYS